MSEIKRVHESVEELESYLGRKLDNNYSKDATYVCYCNNGTSIWYEGTDEFNLEEDVQFDIKRGYVYYYAKVNQPKPYENSFELFKKSILGCEFVRMPYTKTYRQFVHDVDIINGETHLIDQKGVCSLFRTAKFYLDDSDNTCTAEEFMDLLKES
ncbi:hypothetical protein Phab24_id033 [Acinetobacter phage Phab24]|nr:hypothetical protein Phab24_id033 [Acinetobacter phage Phab24]